MKKAYAAKALVLILIIFVQIIPTVNVCAIGTVTSLFSDNFESGDISSPLPTGASSGWSFGSGGPIACTYVNAATATATPIATPFSGTKFIKYNTSGGSSYIDTRWIAPQCAIMPVPSPFTGKLCIEYDVYAASIGGALLVGDVCIRNNSGNGQIYYNKVPEGTGINTIVGSKTSNLNGGIYEAITMGVWNHYKAVYDYDANTSSIYWAPSATIPPSATPGLTCQYSANNPMPDIYGGGIRFAFTNPYNTVYIDNVSIYHETPEAVPLQVAATPDDGAVDVAVSSNPALTFSAAVDPATISGNITLNIGDTPVASSLALSNGNKTVTIVPTGGLDYGRIYTIRATTAVKAATGGGCLTGEFTSNFKTILRPTVLSTLPQNGAKDIIDTRQIITLNWNYPMDSSTFNGNITFRNSSNVDYTFNVYLDKDTKQIMNIEPTKTFSLGDTYTLTIGANVSNTSGLALGTPYVYTYKVSSIVPTFNAVLNDATKDLTLLQNGERPFSNNVRNTTVTIPCQIKNDFMPGNAAITNGIIIGTVKKGAQLVDAKTVTIPSLSFGSTKTYTLPALKIPNYTGINNPYSISLFYWDGLDKIKPIYKGYSLSEANYTVDAAADAGNFVTVVPHHTTMDTRIGYPAMIPPGGDYTTIEITPQYDFTLTADLIFEDGGVIQTLVPQNVTAGSTTTLKFSGKPANQGTYRIRMTYSKNGLDYGYSVYFTVVDPSIFNNEVVPQAYIGANGKLRYTPDYLGNQLMDFSTAGYMKGGAALPTAPVRVVVNPSGGDDTANIQNAINSVSGRALDGDGIRGMVLLAPGNFTVTSQLTINASGVVLCGSGSGAGGTAITFAGGTGININGNSTWTATTTVNAMDLYIPSGSKTLRVQDASAFNVGDEITVNKTVTAKWVKYVNMDQMYRDGYLQQWLPVGRVIAVHRKVAAKNGNTITLDAALADSYDCGTLGFPAATVSKGVYAGMLSKIGLEKFYMSVNPANAGASLFMNNAENCWMNDIVSENLENTVKLEAGCRQITVNNVSTVHTVTNSGLTADFTMNGTNILLSNVKTQTSGANLWSVTTFEANTGPLAVVNSQNKMSPHMRWSTGVLVDNCTYPQDSQDETLGLAFINRGITGSGHGWSTGWSVAWNFFTNSYGCYAAPGSMNYCIGGGLTGATVDLSGNPQGLYQSFGTTVYPNSLYLQQLKDRTGVSALPY